MNKTKLKLKSLLLAATMAFSSNQACLADSFDFELYKTIAANKSKSNLLVSPFSISQALSMTALGASGSTYDSMAKVLGLETQDKVGPNSKELLTSLNNIGGDTTLLIANNLFGNDKVKFRKEYLASTRESFGADLSSLDFASDKSITHINNWAAEKTKGKISKLTDKIDPTTILFLVNAVYFKGNWANKFDQSLTASKSFHTADEQMVKIQTMTADRKDFQYFQTDNFQALSLPYKDGRLSLLLFLPSENGDLESLEKELNQEKWQSWLGQFKKSPGKITLPKFKIEDKMSLKKPLSTMGLTEAFDPDKADFSKMIEATTDDKDKLGICIFDVLHNTSIEISEEGTEAAATTTVVMDRKMATKSEPYFEMKINRPFLFALHDQKTNTTLFMGHISDPTNGKADATLPGEKK